MDSIRVHHSWLVSKVWFPALRSQTLLTCKLSSGAWADPMRTRITFRGVSIRRASWILANSMVTFHFPMLHKLIFPTHKYETWFNEALYLSRKDKCSHKEDRIMHNTQFHSATLHLYKHIPFIPLQNLLKTFDCTGKTDFLLLLWTTAFNTI